jgi:hypothetical protein
MRLIRFAVVLLLLHVSVASASETCPVGKQKACDYVRNMADVYLSAIPSEQEQYKLTEWAFVGAEGSGARLTLKARLAPEVWSQLQQSNQPTLRAQMIASTHARVREAICKSMTELINAGGEVLEIYSFHNDEELARVRVTDCSLAATTWQDTGVDACAPFQWNICAPVERLAAMVNEEAASGRPLQSARGFSLTGARAERGTLILEALFDRSRIEFEQEQPDPSARQAFLDKLRNGVAKLSCNSPGSIIPYGGTIQSVYRFNDGSPMADFAVSHCPTGES